MATDTPPNDWWGDPTAPNPHPSDAVMYGFSSWGNQNERDRKMAFYSKQFRPGLTGSDQPHPARTSTMTFEVQQQTNKPILCVDFDGVVHSYTSGWQGARFIPDPPVSGALEWLSKAVKLFNVVIYSSRSKDPEAIAAMRLWFMFHAHGELPASNAEALLEVVSFAHEKPSAFLTIDDRAICFDGDWGKLDPEALLKFKPWNKQGRASPSNNC